MCIGFPLFDITRSCRDLTANLMSGVCHDVCIEPHLQPITLTGASAITGDEAARLDVAASGFWGGRTFVLRCKSPQSPRSVKQTINPSRVLQKAREHQKTSLRTENSRSRARLFMLKCFGFACTKKYPPFQHANPNAPACMQAPTHTHTLRKRENMLQTEVGATGTCGRRVQWLPSIPESDCILEGTLVESETVRGSRVSQIEAPFSCAKFMARWKELVIVALSNDADVFVWSRLSLWATLLAQSCARMQSEEYSCV